MRVSRGTVFESDMEEVDVVVGASTTACMPHLLARMRQKATEK